MFKVNAYRGYVFLFAGRYEDEFIDQRMKLLQLWMD